MAYDGLFECPKCSSFQTSTKTIATSEKWAWFDCGRCGHKFRKLASHFSELSRTLRKAVGA